MTDDPAFSFNNRFCHPAAQECEAEARCSLWFLTHLLDLGACMDLSLKHRLYMSNESSLLSDVVIAARPLSAPTPSISQPVIKWHYSRENFWLSNDRPRYETESDKKQAPFFRAKGSSQILQAVVRNRRWRMGVL